MKPILIPTLVLTLILAGCGRSAAPAGNDEPPRVHVRVATVESGGRSRSQPLAGIVRPAQQATVAAQVMGTVESTTLAAGQRVEAGELLVRLRAPELNARVEQAQANLSHAKREYEREAALLEQGAATAEAVRALAHHHEAAVAALAETVSLQNYTRISAPFAGVITRELVKAGDLAMPGAPLFTIEGTARLQVVVQVPESFTTPASDRTLTVRIDDTDVAGTLAEISPSAEGSSRTRLAKIDLPAEVPARSGQFVRVFWPMGQTETLSVPASAISRFGQMERAFVVEENRARLRLVRTGAREEGDVIVLAGLNPGEQVVLDSPPGLRDGQLVEITP